MGKIKLGIWGDAVAPTGFARVLHSIAKNLPKKDYNIFWIGVNYFGDPHEYKDLKIYPAGLSKSDPYGFGRVADIFKLEKPDIIFILNDAWIVTKCLDEIKKAYKDKPLPKIVTYIPVDALDHDSAWYANFDIVTKLVAYTEFGKYAINQASKREDIAIIPHGIDSSVFYKLQAPKDEIKRKLYPKKPEYEGETFIVLNASRNQPRKRLDLTLQGFELFSHDKPAGVKLYMHCGLTDAHIHVTKLAQRYGIDSRLIVSNQLKGIQTVTDAALNLIYNATDVGLNTSIGEGWCLPCMEHAVTGAPQVVPGHSALLELYKDCGSIVPVTSAHVIDNIMTTGFIVSPDSVAEQLEKLYTDRAYYNSLSEKTMAKFTDAKYMWSNIAIEWDKLFKEL